MVCYVALHVWQLVAAGQMHKVSQLTSVQTIKILQLSGANKMSNVFQKEKIRYKMATAMCSQTRILFV